MDEPTRRRELKGFLRARREALKPEQVGLRGGARRRTPGLRREEVATAADVGVTWYTWLEQGREITVSHDALDRIAHALRLSPSDRRYLFQLAGVEHADADISQPPILPHVQLVLDTSTIPAFCMNARLDVIAFNRLADLMYDFNGHRGSFGNNHVWRCFMDPKRRRLYRDWPDMAAAAAGWLRANYASHIGDAGYEDLIQTLVQASPEFVRIWDARQTISVALSLPVRLDTPRFGNLDVHSVRFLVPGGPGYILIFLPPANAATAAVFAKEARRHLSDAVRSPRRAARP